MFNLNKLDEQMLRHWSRLSERLDVNESSNPEDFVKKLFIDRALNDLLLSSGLSISNEDKKDLLNKVKQANPSSVESIINNIVKSIGMKAVAYPNTNYSVGLLNKVSDEEKFSALAAAAHHYVSLGANPNDAFFRVLQNLKSTEEKMNFLSWYGLKTNKELKHLALRESNQKETMIKKAYDSDGNFIYEFMRQRAPKQDFVEDKVLPKESHIDPMAAQDFGKMREKMIGRTFAIDKLLEKSRNLLTQEQFESIEDVLNTLRKNIRKLKMASLSDSIQKTAFIAEQNNWFEGAMIARELLSTDDKFIKMAAAASSDKLEEVINSLSETSAYLRQRAMIRELSSRDIDLFNLGFGHIGEVGDAAVKLIEAFNSAANKIDDVTSRLKGELRQQTSPKKTPTKIKQIVNPEDLPLVKVLKNPDDSQLPQEIEENSVAEPLQTLKKEPTDFPAILPFKNEPTKI